VRVPVKGLETIAGLWGLSLTKPRGSAKKSAVNGVLSAQFMSGEGKNMALVRRPISTEGHKKLREELDRLTRVERPSVIKEIEIALGHGDLSENAEFTYAKEKASLIETRIRDLQERLSACEVIDLETRPASDRIVFGTSVTIEDVETNERKVFRILGPDETDIGNGIISVDSPLGRALIGKEEDDVVEVKTPNGIREYEILKVS
jgi:transcription elongation factor GreA